MYSPIHLCIPFFRECYFHGMRARKHWEHWEKQLHDIVYKSGRQRTLCARGHQRGGSRQEYINFKSAALNSH
jgi:hypothetical protein